MPFETALTPFTGDDSLGDFMLDVWLPFARDDCGWVDNRAPVVGARPDIEVWTHRGTTGAPEPPFFFVHTSSKHMHIFTGTGVDTGEEIYDQPGNPCNAPLNTGFTVGGSIEGMKCGFLNTLVGPYQAYWLFSDTSGSYVHCVVKVSARHYRHFHVGLLRALHPDLDDGAFYVTTHTWSRLAPDSILMTDSDGGSAARNEHDPYTGHHVTPFGHSTGSNTDFSKKYQLSTKFYIPGIRTDTTNHFYLPQTVNTGVLETTSKTVGTVNASGYVHGIANCSGYRNGLGAILFASAKTFTSGMVPLVPIYVSAAAEFEGQTRQAVVAQIPDVFRVNMRDIAAEQEITVGSDTYVCFPLINKDNANVLDGEGYSGYEGLAYKKITAPVA